jgi:hypothetical protein
VLKITIARCHPALPAGHWRWSGGWGGGEGFIGHFLWEYACHFPDRHQAFTSITGRLPYYMALNLLRIAANDYLGPDYRHQLVSQAKHLLQAP